MNLTHTKKQIFRKILFVILKRKWTILIVFGLIVAIVTTVSFIIKPTYEATTRIAITVQYEADETAQQDKGVAQEKLIRAELELLAGSTIIREVISEIGLRALYPDMYVKYLDNKDFSPTDGAVVIFQENLQTKASKNSDVITISFQHEDPDMAAQALNRLIESLKQRHIPPSSQPEAPAVEKIVKSTKRADVSKGPAKTGQDRTNNKSTESLLKQKEDLTSKISAVESELSKTNAAISANETSVQDIRSRLSASEKRAGAGDSVPPGSESMSALRQRLKDLRQKEQGLLKTYSETSGNVTLVRQEIWQVEQLLAREESVEYRKAFVMVDQELKTLRSRASSQAADISQSQMKLTKIERALEEAAEIEAQREAAKAKEEASRKAPQEPTIHVSVVEHAVPPSKPVRPIMPINIALAIVLGLVSGIGAAFIAEHRSHTFNFPKEVEEHLGMRVLASVNPLQLQERKSSEPDF